MLIKIIDRAIHGTAKETWINTDHVSSVVFDGTNQAHIKLTNGTIFSLYLNSLTPHALMTKLNSESIAP